MSKRVTFRVRAEFLIATDTNGNCDPYLTISRPRNRNELSGPLYEIYKSKVMDATVNPQFEPFTLTLEDLCSGDTALPLLWTIKDKDLTNSDDYVGFATISIDQAMQAILKPGTKFTLVDTKRQKEDPKYTNSGSLVFDAVAIN